MIHGSRDKTLRSRLESITNTNVVEIDKKGNVKVIAEGTAILKATCDDWSLELRVTVER